MSTLDNYQNELYERGGTSGVSAFFWHMNREQSFSPCPRYSITTECDATSAPIRQPIYQPVTTQRPVGATGHSWGSGANDNKGPPSVPRILSRDAAPVAVPVLACACVCVWSTQQRRHVVCSCTFLPPRSWITPQWPPPPTHTHTPFAATGPWREMRRDGRANEEKCRRLKYVEGECFMCVQYVCYLLIWVWGHCLTFTCHGTLLEERLWGIKKDLITSI